MKISYDHIFWAGLILWLLETAYFGWNETAQSGAERVLDIVSAGLVLYGVVGIIARGAAEKVLNEILSKAVIRRVPGEEEKKD